MECAEDSYPAEVIDLTQSEDETVESETESDDDLPSLRSIIFGHEKWRKYTDASDHEDNRQRERNTNGSTSTSTSSGEMTFPFALPDTRRDHHGGTATTGSRRSVTTSESPSQSRREYERCSSESSNKTTLLQEDELTPSIRERDDTGPGKEIQSSTSSTQQLEALHRTRDVFPAKGRDAQKQNPEIDQILAGMAGASFLGVYGERPSDHGPEYACIVEMWLHPEDGIPYQQIWEYKREVVRCGRLSTLRKRKYESCREVPDEEVIKRVRYWKGTVHHSDTERTRPVGSGLPPRNNE